MWKTFNPTQCPIILLFLFGHHYGENRPILLASERDGINALLYFTPISEQDIWQGAFVRPFNETARLSLACEQSTGHLGSMAKAAASCGIRLFVTVLMTPTELPPHCLSANDLGIVEGDGHLFGRGRDAFGG